MGTGCTTKFYQIGLDDKGKEKKLFVGAIYRHQDGYLEEHGRELKSLLSGKKVINGFRLGMTTKKYFNGITCCGAWVISKLKEDFGNIHLTTKDDYQEYNYEIYNNKKDIMITVRDRNKKIIFKGHIEDLPVESN